MGTAIALSARRIRIRRFGSGRLWLSLASAIPLLGLLNDPPDTMLPIFSIYVALWWLRRPIRVFVNRIPGPRMLLFWIGMVLAGSLTEILAWSSSYFAAENEPALFHPQLGADLLLAVPFYSAWAVAWLLLSRRYAFTVKERFLYQGLYGVLVEQLGAVFIAGLVTMPLGLVLWLYVFLVYGSATGIATLPFDSYFMRAKVTSVSRKRKTLVTFIVLLVATFAISGPVFWALGALDLIPPRQDIRAHPFW